MEMRKMSLDNLLVPGDIFVISDQSLNDLNRVNEYWGRQYMVMNIDLASLTYVLLEMKTSEEPFAVFPGQIPKYKKSMHWPATKRTASMGIKDQYRLIRPDIELIIENLTILQDAYFNGVTNFMGNPAKQLIHSLFDFPSLMPGASFDADINNRKLVELKLDIKHEEHKIFDAKYGLYKNDSESINEMAKDTGFSVNVQHQTPRILIPGQFNNFTEVKERIEYAAEKFKPYLLTKPGRQ